MNLLGKLFLKMAGVQTGQTYSLQDAALGKFLGGGPSASGKTITEETMMQVSAAWSCMRILAETIGSLPWHVYEDDGKGNSRKVDGHPVAQVLMQSPNANMTSVEYREAAVLNLCQTGNTYAFRNFRGAGDLDSLNLIESCKVQPFQKDSGALAYRVLDRGKWEVYPQEKIWHVKGFGRNGLVGLSPLGAAREALGAALATEEFGSRFFSQGGMPGGVVSFPGWLNADQRAIARDNMNQMLGGIGNSHKFALFEGGIKPEPWGNMPLEDMQFITTRKFSIQEICRFYRIPPHMVADLDRATFSNIEHMSQEFVMFTLMPYFTRFEASATKWLFKPGERDRYYLRFNYEGLLRADSAARATFYSQALQNGYMTRNEVRGKENMPRSDEEGMDEFTVQLNMTTVDSIGEVAEVAPAPPAIREPAEIEGEEKAIHPNNFNLVFPDTMKHQVVDAAETRATEELTAAVLKTTKENAAMINMLTNTVKQLTKRTEDEMVSVKRAIESSKDAVEEVRQLAGADRMAIFDEKGDPIGTRVVKTHATH